MDSGTGQILSKVLNRWELDEIPNETATKIERYFDDRFKELLTSQALLESSTPEHEKILLEYEKLVQELTTKNEYCEMKLEALQQESSVLWIQKLDEACAQVNRYQATISTLQAENIGLQRQVDNLTIERDSLQSTLESRCTEIERIKRDVPELVMHLNAAINAIGEIQAKEASLEYKERRMEQDRSIMQSSLQSLTESYNSNLEELTAIRCEMQQNRLDLESTLTEKIEELPWTAVLLSIANSTVAHLQETNEALMNRIEELSAMHKEEADEAAKLIDWYKNELLAKSELADICRKESDDYKSRLAQLSHAITDLPKLVNESMDEYVELETKYTESALQHTKDLEEKDNIIENLKMKLKNANDLRKMTHYENLDQGEQWQETSSNYSLSDNRASNAKRRNTEMDLNELETNDRKSVRSIDRMATSFAADPCAAIEQMNRIECVPGDLEVNPESTAQFDVNRNSSDAVATITQSREHETESENIESPHMVDDSQSNEWRENTTDYHIQAEKNSSGNVRMTISC